AKIDGASPIQIAFKIKVPLIMNVFKVTIVLSIVGSLKYFDLIYVMTNGGRNGASEVMACYMYKLAFANHDFGYGSAIGFLLLISTLIVTVIIRKLTATDEELQFQGGNPMTKFGYILLYVCLAIVAVFQFLPILCLFTFSLKTNQAIFSVNPFSI